MRLKGLFPLVLVTVLVALLAGDVADARQRKLQQGEESVLPGACTGDASGDFDNNDSADLAVGVPGEDLKGKINAGAVNVIYGSSASAGLTAGGDGSAPTNQFWHQGVEGIPTEIAENDKFGRCNSAGDFNGDGYSDLAIGAPEEATGAGSNVGVVHVLYGSNDGLAIDAGPGTQLFTQTQPDGPGKAEPGDEFGAALARGDFNNDGIDDLAVGAPLEDNAGKNSGAVTLLLGSDDGLTYEGSKYLHQGAAGGTADVAEADDKFGASLAAGDIDGDGDDDLAVGVPEENLPDDGDNEKEAGAVHIFYGLGSGLAPSSEEFWTQDTEGVLDDSEDGDNFGWSLTLGDFNGDSFDDLAVGTTHESIGDVRNAGAVNVLYGTADGLSSSGDDFWHQGNTESAETIGEFEFFGAALAAGDFEAGRSPIEDLAIGIPGESVGGARRAGAVEVLYGEAGTGLDGPAQLITQDTPNVEDFAEFDDEFGQSITAGSYDQDAQLDVAIGIPGENITGGTKGDGAVAVIYATSSGLSPTATPNDEFWHQDSPGILDTAEPNDLFGRALA